MITFQDISKAIVRMRKTMPRVHDETGKLLPVRIPEELIKSIENTLYENTE